MSNQTPQDNAEKAPVNKMTRNEKIATVAVIVVIAYFLWPFAQRQGAFPVAEYMSPDGKNRIEVLRLPEIIPSETPPGVVYLKGSDDKIWQMMNVSDAESVPEPVWSDKSVSLKSLTWPLPDPEAEAAK